MDIFCLLLAFVLLVFCLAFELYFLYAVLLSRRFKYPPAFPSFGKMKKVALSEAEKVLQAADRPLSVVDLGCGTGGLLLPLAKKFPEHHFVGYDWDFLVCLILKWRCRKLKNVSVVHADFMQADFSAFDLLLCFLENKAIEDLKPVFPEKLKKNAVIISLAFALKNMTPTHIFDAKSYGMPLKVFLYRYGNNL